ncbi:MAG TPA: hypothetical protein VLV87_03305 [Gammaproteobacteria bacterium]|nr:hypothetical protein [Gammaproteobacteria bacterium]
MRISVIALGLALSAVTTAWGAESVMNLISSGEAVNKEVTDTKAAYDAISQKNKDLIAEGKQLNVDQEKLKQDIAAYQSDSAKVQQSTADYKSRCGGGKQLTQDEYKACNASLTQINADVARVNGEFPALKQREDQLNSKIAAHNQDGQGIDKKINDAYQTWNSALKKQGSWLDQARSQLTSDAFKPYAQKAGCPDTTKPAKTADAQIKMSDQVVACLKKVSNS